MPFDLDRYFPTAKQNKVIWINTGNKSKLMIKKDRIGKVIVLLRWSGSALLLLNLTVRHHLHKNSLLELTLR